MAKVSSAALKVKIAALQAQLVTVEAEEKLTQICVAVGDSLTFMFGRAANRKKHQGVVRFIAETDKGNKYNVLAGGGADEQIYVISQSDIVVGDFAPVDDEIEKELTGVGGASADPLALLS